MIKSLRLYKSISGYTYAAIETSYDDIEKAIKYCIDNKIKQITVRDSLERHKYINVKLANALLNKSIYKQWGLDKSIWIIT